jgi:hypothetical protein
MNEEDIKKLVTEKIYQTLDGMSKENNKFDFKKEWYDLKNEIKMYEFLKDISAIINTPGPDGFIVIGFDDKAKNYSNSVFSDSNLKDKNEIVGIINRRIEHAFEINIHDIEIEGHKLSVIHIPPSTKKPHFIRNYKTRKKEEQHRIFIKNDTTTKIAGRDDLERMLWDNKNPEPEYNFELSLNIKSIVFNRANSGELEVGISGVVIENLSSRNLAIANLEFELTFNDEIERLIFKNARIKLENGYNDLKHKKLIIKALTIEQFDLKLYTNFNFNEKVPNALNFNSRRDNITEIIANIILINNKAFSMTANLTK